MKKLLVSLLLLAILNAEFVLENVDVTISDISKDGSVHVTETINMIIKGESEQRLYDGAFNNNDLAFWKSTTQLDDIRLHLSQSKVKVDNLRIRPQPRERCNAFLKQCRGKLIFEYTASPHKNLETNQIIEGTGVFIVDNYKPRAYRYSINPKALAFTTTDDGNILLSDNAKLNIVLPDRSIIYHSDDLNPLPRGFDQSFPIYVSKLTWTDAILVKFSLVFEIEDSLEKEVVSFFSNLIQGLTSYLSSEQGIAITVLIAILLGSYTYLQSKKKS